MPLCSFLEAAQLAGSQGSGEHRLPSMGEAQHLAPCISTSERITPCSQLQIPSEQLEEAERTWTLPLELSGNS